MWLPYWKTGIRFGGVRTESMTASGEHLTVSDVPSLKLLARWRQDGDQDAASELFVRYAGRLIALARSRLSPKLARRVDAEDVVQSVCRTFFVRVRDGRLDIQPGSDLWQLLAGITMHKLFDTVDRHTAAKRSIHQETGDAHRDGDRHAALELAAAAPTPAQIAAVADERERALQQLSPLHRRMVELRLEEYTQAEIAARTQRSERMVRLVLSEFGERLQRRLQEVAR